MPSALKSTDNHGTTVRRASEVRDQIAELEAAQVGAARELTDAKARRGVVLLDGTPVEKEAVRTRIRELETGIEERDAVLATLQERLQEAEQRELDASFASDLQRYRKLSLATEPLLAKYATDLAPGMVDLLRELRKIASEASEIEVRFKKAGRSDELHAGGIRRPGCTDKGRRLFEDEHLSYMPRVDDEGTWYRI